MPPLSVKHWCDIVSRAKDFSFASSLSGAAKKLELAKVDTPSGA